MGERFEKIVSTPVFVINSLQLDLRWGVGPAVYVYDIKIYIEKSG